MADMIKLLKKQGRRRISEVRELSGRLSGQLRSLIYFIIYFIPGGPVFFCHE